MEARNHLKPLRSLHVFSPRALKHYYYQFAESLVESFHTLSIKTSAMDCIDDLVAANLGSDDVVLVLTNLAPKNPEYHGVLSAARDFLVQRNVNIIAYETEPQNSVDIRRYQMWAPIAIWTYK